MTSAHRVVARYLAAKNPIEDRIKAIPRYERSNFLMSILTQVQRGYALSPKQVTVLEKIEREQGSNRPEQKFDVDFASRGHLVDADLRAIIALLRKQDTVRVRDRYNVIPKLTLDKAIRKELNMDFAGRWETSEEVLADVDDPKLRAKAEAMAKLYWDAASHVETAKIEQRREGNIVTFEMRPSYQDIKRKFRLP